MTYIPGELLSKFMERCKDDIREIKRVEKFALDALRQIHSHGLLHNDIRHENIIVTTKPEYNRVVIIDLARAAKPKNITSKEEVFQREEAALRYLFTSYDY
jgi:serine/threonine protein kinase